MPEDKKQSGMTLIEILVAIVMFSIIATSIYNVFRVHNIMAAKQEETTMMQQELLTTIVVISDELRMCGYTPINSVIDFGLVLSDTNDRNTNETSVYCTRGGMTGENSTVDIAYKLDNSNQIISYHSANGTWDNVISSNISDLKFTYFDEDENEISLPLNTATINNIRMIEINATAIPSPNRSALGIGSRTMNTRVWLRNLSF